MIYGVFLVQSTNWKFKLLIFWLRLPKLIEIYKFVFFFLFLDLTIKFIVSLNKFIFKIVVKKMPVENILVCSQWF